MYIAGNGGQYIGFAAVGQRMQQGNGAYIIIVRAKISIEDHLYRGFLLGLQ